MGFVVDGKLRVFAYPNPGKVGRHTGHIPDRGCWPGVSFTAAQVAALAARVSQVSPEYYIIGYDDLNQLITQIAALLQSETWTTGTPPVIHHHPCLEVLEIRSHSRPAKCGGICEGNIRNFAGEIDSLVYCDELKIYLSGCNTGNVDDNFCIAQSLADLIPAARRQKQYRCTVYGTKGYQTGSNAGKNSNVTRDYTDAQGHVYPRYEHSEDQKLPRKTQSTADDPTYRGFRGANSA